MGRARQFGPREPGVLRPVCREHDQVSAGDRLFCGVDATQPLDLLFCPDERPWIVRAHRAAAGNQLARKAERRRIPDIVSLRLVGHAQHRHQTGLERAELSLEPIADACGAAIIRLAGRLNQVKRLSSVPAQSRKVRELLRQTRSPKTDAGAEVRGADARIEANRVHDLVDVRIVGLTQVGYLVDQAQLRGEECVGGVLDHLCRFEGCDDDGRSDPFVQLSHGFRSRVLCPRGSADHDARRLANVPDRAPLAQELRIASDDHYRIWESRHKPACRDHLREVGLAVRIQRCSDTDKDNVGSAERVLRIVVRAESAVTQCCGHQLLEARFVHRDPSGDKRVNPRRIRVVDAHLSIGGGDVDRGNQPDIARPQNADSHERDSISRRPDAGLMVVLIVRSTVAACRE